MFLRRSLTCAAALLLLAAANFVATPQARADSPSCAPATTFSATSTPPAAGAPTNSPSHPSADQPCWVDWDTSATPYPFGIDGNPVDPSLEQCNSVIAPCNLALTLQVTSMSFRAWNRGLAATTATTFPASGGGAGAYGVWLFNGRTWFPDPTFPGSAACPGAKVLWAGKLDYWLIGGATPGAQQTLCRFDGVNLEWEELTLPAATRAQVPVNPLTLQPVGGITSGACFAWNNCWFFGADGIQVHWDGQTLSNAPSGLGTSPWLQGDYTAAVARTDPVGNEFGFAVSGTGATNAAGIPGGQPVPPQPHGSPPPQLYGSRGGSFTPLAFSPPATPRPNDPFTTDLVGIDSDSQGDVWAAADPSIRAQSPQTDPAPLLRLTEGGSAAPCPGYDASTFAFSNFPFPSAGSYQWTSLSVFPSDGSALAGAEYLANGAPEPMYRLSSIDFEPELVRAACGQAPTITRFRTLDPFFSDPTTAPLVPADLGGFTTAVAANASNDGWAATTAGGLGFPIVGGVQTSFQPPHLYRWTDGQPVDAPAGDDNEPRPSLFTLGPPVFVITPPAVVVAPSTNTTTTKRAKPKKVKLKPAVYSVKSTLHRSPNGQFVLVITFKVRRPVVIGAEALHGHVVVASSGLKRFKGRTGELSLTLDRAHWPTGLRFVTRKPHAAAETPAAPR